MTITIEIDKLSDLLFAAWQSGANSIGVNPDVITITLAEVKIKHGVAFAKAARMSTAIKWMPVGSGGRTSGVYCKKSDIDKFLFERKFDFNS